MYLGKGTVIHEKGEGEESIARGYTFRSSLVVFKGAVLVCYTVVQEGK